jgi:hypothetical protein
LAIDEADCIIGRDYATSFFGLIRAWYNKGASDLEWEKLSTVLVISTEPYLLINDLTHQSPFNIDPVLNLKDFDKDQVQELNRRYQCYGPSVQTSDLPAVMHLFNGHPYLTHKALFTIVTEKLSWAELVNIAITDDGPFGIHLRRQYRLLLDQPNLQEALRQIISANTCADDRAIYRLSRAGLIKGIANHYTLRCDLYRRYLEKKLC